MVPAVRSLNGTCVDSPNCYYERITLCAFNLTTSGLKGQVDFLDCMDSPWDVELKPNKPYKCAKENNIDELSIGMSNDYDKALQFDPKYIRLGTILFGQRK